MGIDEGKYILAGALDNIITLRSMIVSDPSGEISGPLEEVARQLRGLSRHQLYMDGGTSFRAFWVAGDQAIETMNALLATVDNVLEDRADA